MYVFPAYLPRPLQASYTTDESARFQISQPGGGAYFSQIVSDDAPTYFNLRWAFPLAQAQVFRAWLRQDNFAILNGAQFEIDLPTEDGIITQTASFLPDGIPQRSGEQGHVLFYDARVMVRKLNEPSLGGEDLILGVAEMGGSPLLDVIVNVDLPEI